MPRATLKDASRLSWEEYRRQMLDGTAKFIEWGLNHPDQVIPIPARRLDEPNYPLAVAQWFWQTVLSETSTRVSRWRNLLRWRK